MLHDDVSPMHWLRLAGLLRRRDVCLAADPESDRPYIDRLRASHPGLDRACNVPEIVSGGDVIDRWIQLVILRGLQIFASAEGNDVLLLGGLEAPFLAVHKNYAPLAVKGIPPKDTLFAPELPDGDRIKLGRQLDAAAAASLSAMEEVAKEAPLPGDVFAERVWGLCRARTYKVGPARNEDEQRQRDRIITDWEGRPTLEKLEMALALSDRVLSGRDKPGDRQLYAGVAHIMWTRLSLDWNEIGAPDARMRGWQRVACLADLEASVRDAMVVRVRDAMGLVCQDKPVDIKVMEGKTMKVYRFHQGQRQLIDRRGGWKGRVH